MSFGGARRHFERYNDAGQDEKGIYRVEGPLIAWFKDLAGNVLSVMPLH